MFSGHGLRSGCLTEAADRGIPSPKPCSSRCISPSLKLPATTMTASGRRGALPGSSADPVGISARRLNCAPAIISGVRAPDDPGGRLSVPGRRASEVPGSPWGPVATENCGILGFLAIRAEPKSAVYVFVGTR